MNLHLSSIDNVNVVARAERSITGGPANVFLSFRTGFADSRVFACMSPTEAREAAEQLRAAADAAEAMDAEKAAAANDAALTAQVAA